MRPRASKSERLRWEILAIGVGAAFALSYYSMRWYLSRAPQEPAEDPSVEAPAEPQSPVAEAPAPAPATPPAVDAGPAVARLTPRPEADLGEYRDATPWLDGSVLPARSGILAVSAPEGRAVSVQVDQRDVGVAPLHLVLAEGLHTVRFRAGDGWRYQFATVRAGQAVLLRAPQAVP